MPFTGSGKPECMFSIALTGSNNKVTVLGLSIWYETANTANTDQSAIFSINVTFLIYIYIYIYICIYIYNYIYIGTEPELSTAIYTAPKLAEFYSKPFL